MFRLELDLHLYFVPPMEEHGPAIVLTREVELPFPPAENIAIHSRKFDECPDPLGFHLKDLIWDIDRNVFLSYTVVVSSDLPFPFILGDVRNWIARGWRLGSYRDTYPQAPEDEPADTKQPRDVEHIDDETMETWPSLPPRSRPEDFNRTFGVITRVLAETRNAESLAYAMHRTKMFFTKAQLRGEKTAAKERFEKARDEFYKLPLKKQEKWIDRIVAAYPSLAEEVAG